MSQKSQNETGGRRPEAEEKKGQQTMPRSGALAKPAGRGGVSRPPVRAALCQLAIGVIDVSPSMDGAKLDEANAAMEALWHELIGPKNQDGFWLALATYASQAGVHLAPTRATVVQRADLIAKSNSRGGGTNITAGLATALEVIERAARDRNDWTRPVVVLLTDGKHCEGPPPDTIAGGLKQVADLVCVGFGHDAEFGLLRRLATKPELAFQCASGPELRACFQNVGASMSKSRGTGQGVASILGAPPGSVVRG